MTACTYLPTSTGTSRWCVRQWAPNLMPLASPNTRYALAMEASMQPRSRDVSAQSQVRHSMTAALSLNIDSKPRWERGFGIRERVVV